MNMLIIGNGFDLAHERPTTYEDFLNFAESIMRIQTFKGSQTEFQADLLGLHPGVMEYVLKLREDTAVSQVNGQVHTNNEILREMWNCLDENVWYKYFQSICKENKIRGKDWIDFESEIQEVIKFFDERFHDLYEPFSIPATEIPALSSKIRNFYSKLEFSRFKATKNRDEKYRVTCSDFIEKTYQDLESLIRCLEIYLDDCVRKMPILSYSPDIKDLKIDFTLSFNYTTIPTDIYPSLTNTHYIHGCAKSDRLAADNDMVLGVNEYWEGKDKDTNTNFNLYKKFVQRIIKETGIGYKEILRVMITKYKDFEQRQAITGWLHTNNVYIFGHSLDVTDGDILREIMLSKGIVTTIFYRDKQQQANQIANLSKVLTQEKLLQYTLSTYPNIIFRQQANMEKL